jgi:hypothetical protein
MDRLSFSVVFVLAINVVSALGAKLTKSVDVGSSPGRGR